MDWIKVEENLPDRNKRVLLFLENNKGETLMVVGYVFYSNSKHFEKINGEFVLDTGGIPEILNNKFIKAWIELPSKPEDLDEALENIKEWK